MAFRIASRLAVAFLISACVGAPVLTIAPQRGLIDQPLRIQVDGLMPQQQFVVRAVMRLDGETILASHAGFRADPRGHADVEKQTPSGGTYEQGEMGLLWSMNADDVPQRFRNSDLPFAASIAEPYTVAFELEVDGTVAATALVERWFTRADVRTEEVREPGLVGQLFLPAVKNKVPAVVLLGGSEGGLETGSARGRLLASRGYVALSVAYFRAPGLPDRLTAIPVETVERACDYLSGLSEVDSGRIGIIGVSRGAELALLSASAFPRIKAVVAYSPSNASWAAMATGSQTAAWTLAGEPVPFVPNPPADLIAGFRRMTSGLPPSLQALILSYAHNVQHAEIPVERINGPVLLISGTDDRVWPSSTMADLVVTRMKEHGAKFRAEHISFGEAGHIINFPFMPTSTRTQLGGTPPGLARADRESWKSVIEFLEKNLLSQR